MAGRHGPETDAGPSMTGCNAPDGHGIPLRRSIMFSDVHLWRRDRSTRFAGAGRASSSSLRRSDWRRNVRQAGVVTQ